MVIFISKIIFLSHNKQNRKINELVICYITRIICYINQFYEFYIYLFGNLISRPVRTFYSCMDSNNFEQRLGGLY